MKAKNQGQSARPLWTPARVKGWLERCPKSDKEEDSVLKGWIVDGEFYCAECVHRLVENNIPLPAKATAGDPMTGSIAVFPAADFDDPCQGCEATPDAQTQ